MSYRRLAVVLVMPLVVMLCVVAWQHSVRGDEPARELLITSLGTQYAVSPAIVPQIAARVSEIRDEVKRQRHRKKLIVYISIPISRRGGGYEPINSETSGDIKRHLEKDYGADKLWALAPGQPVTSSGKPIVLEPVGTAVPDGADYMYMWTQVLAGEKGNGEDFDMVYFAGPSHFHRYLGVSKPDLLGKLERYVDKRAEADAEFKKLIADKPSARAEFIRYYGLRASAVYSPGAHDEWNIFVLLNRKRDISNQISVYFDGLPVATGAVDASATLGYERLRTVR